MAEIKFLLFPLCCMKSQELASQGQQRYDLEAPVLVVGCWW
jgi:hypothetical protein